MSRFERELNGSLGEFWKKSAEQELEQLTADIEAGRITIDAEGIARNCIGRVIMNDLLEKLTYITERVNVEATTAAREAEVAAELAAYRKTPHNPSAEEKAEMRAAFGEGTKIVNVLDGSTFTL